MKRQRWPGEYFAQGPDKYGDVCVTSDLGGRCMRLVIANMPIPDPEIVRNSDNSPVTVEQGTGLAVETAKLFAAAPDLLKAAEEVLDLFEKFNSHGMVFCRADMAGLVAAVAKAKGE